MHFLKPAPSAAVYVYIYIYIYIYIYTYIYTYISTRDNAQMRVNAAKANKPVRVSYVGPSVNPFVGSPSFPGSKLKTCAPPKRVY